MAAAGTTNEPPVPWKGGWDDHCTATQSFAGQLHSPASSKITLHVNGLDGARSQVTQTFPYPGQRKWQLSVWKDNPDNFAVSFCTGLAKSASPCSHGDDRGGQDSSFGAMTQSEKCLLCLHEDLNSIPSTQVKKAFNPTTREAETRGGGGAH